MKIDIFIEKKLSQLVNFKEELEFVYNQTSDKDTKLYLSGQINAFEQAIEITGMK